MAKTLIISTKEISLVREQGEVLISSYEQPGQRPDRQSYQWHDGKALLELAKKLERYRRSTRAAQQDGGT